MNTYKALSKQIFKLGAYSLVPIRFEDRFDIMQWRNEQIYHLRQAKPLTQKDQDSYFENVISKLFDHEQPNQILFSFLHEETCIGYGGLVHINWIDKNAELSFIMNTELEKIKFQENWLIFISLIEQVAFEELKFHKIFTYAFDLRPNLYTVLEKAGFKVEAKLNEHALFHGKAIDVLIHSKINNKVELIPATSSDIDITYEWASNQEVRKYAFNQQPITYEEHERWFMEKLTNPSCHYYILQRGAEKIGSIRIDINDDAQEGIISYLINPIFHGNGFGTLILALIEEKLKNSISSITLKGLVMETNEASIRIFKKLKYSQKNNMDNILTFTKKIK